MMNNEIRSTQAIAQRLTNLRNASGLTRKEVETRYGIKSASLRSWEIGNRTVKKRTAEILAAIFKKHGIICTADWILKGEGLDPLETSAQSTEEACILRQIYLFESFYDDGSIVIQAEDNYMAPWIQKGDFVGGVFINQGDSANFVDQVCIVKTCDFGMQMRLINKTENDKLFNLVSFSNKGNILNVELEAVAVVLFHRRRLGALLEENLPSLTGLPANQRG
jgi:transcriptional regulator with XRE-family HTH domain